MDRILIIGCSCSGKSTLARAMGKKLHLPVVHLDQLWWREGWHNVTLEEFDAQLAKALKQERWIIDGNYGELYFNERLTDADRIILFQFSRVRCLIRVLRRYQMYKGQTRPDLAENCPEKIDAEFLFWVLFKGRSRRRRNHFKQIAQQYADKAVVLKSPRAVKQFLSQNKY